MKKKILNEEIDRILSLMGQNYEKIGDTVIQEQKLWPELRNAARELLDPKIVPGSRVGAAERHLLKGGEVMQDFYEKVSELLNKTGDELDTAYERFVTGKVGNSQVDNLEVVNQRVNQLSNLLKSGLSDFLYKRLLQAWFSVAKEGAQSEALFYKTLSRAKKDALKGGGSFDFDNELAKFIDDPLQRSILSPKIQKRLSEYEDSPIKFKTEVIKPVEKELTALTQSEKNSLLRKLTTRSTFWTDVFGAWEKNLNDLQDELLALSKNFVDESAIISNASSPEMAKKELESITSAYAMQLTRTLNKIKMRFPESAVDSLESLGLPNELITKIKTDPNQFFKVFRENFGLIQGNSVFKNSWNTLKEAFKSVFTQVFKSLKLLWERKFSELVLQVLDINTNLGTWFWTQAWGGMNTLYGLAVRYGMKNNKDFLKWLGPAFIYTMIASVIGWLVNGFLNVIWNGLILPLGRAVNGILCWSILSKLGWCDTLYKEIVGEGDVWISGIFKSAKKGFMEGLKKTFTSEHPINTILKSIPGISSIWGAAVGGGVDKIISLTPWQTVEEYLFGEAKNNYDKAKEEVKKEAEKTNKTLPPIPEWTPQGDTITIDVSK